MCPGNRTSELGNSLKSFTYKCTSAVKVGLWYAMYSLLKLNTFQKFYGNFVN